jgi:hypothetical protein
MDILKNIFGGGTPDNYEQRAQQYQQGYQSGQLGGLSDQDVAQRYQRTVQYAPPDVVEQAHAEAFNRLPPQEQQQIVAQFQQAHTDPQQPFQYPGFNSGQQSYSPAQMGQMARQAQQQQPDLLQQVLGPGGALSSPMAKAAMAGVAAIAAQKMMGGQGGGLLGGLLGNRQ